MNASGNDSRFVKNVKKIAVLRANALGDFIVTLPALHAIKTNYPEAELTLLGKPWHAAFLNCKRSPVDRVIIVPVIKGVRDEFQKDDTGLFIENFFSEMQREKFDIAIHFQGKGIAANPFIKKLGAKLTAGLTCNEAEKINRSVPFYYYQNEIARYLEVAALIGAVPVCMDPKIKVLQEDIREASKYLSEKNITNYIVIHPFGMDKRRNWAAEKFAQVADLLTQRGYKLIFTGASTDRNGIDDIISYMRFSAYNAGGSFSLGGLSALLLKSKLVIAIDTGPLHLAHAVGAKTVGIYWAPNLINWAPMSRRFHRPVISWDLYCHNCGTIPNDPYPFEPATPICKHEGSFIRDITVDEVMKQTLTLLSP